MVKQKMLSVALIGGFLILSGCASIVSEASWPVSVKSTPENADYMICNEDGQVVSRGQTPETVTLPGSAGYFDGAAYFVRYSKLGFEDDKQTIDSRLNGWYWGNLLFSGPVGLLMVDPVTGAMWRLPESVHVTLVPELDVTPDDLPSQGTDSCERRSEKLSRK